MAADERNRRIVEECCKILDNFQMDESTFAYKAQMQMHSIAQIIRLASGLNVGPDGTV